MTVNLRKKNERMIKGFHTEAKKEFLGDGSIRFYKAIFIFVELHYKNKLKKNHLNTMGFKFLMNKNQNLIIASEKSINT